MAATDQAIQANGLIGILRYVITRCGWVKSITYSPVLSRSDFSAYSASFV